MCAGRELGSTDILCGERAPATAASGEALEWVEDRSGESFCACRVDCGDRIRQRLLHCPTKSDSPGIEVAPDTKVGTQARVQRFDVSMRRMRSLARS
jgi:hypothetical protein